MRVHINQLPKLHTCILISSVHIQTCSMSLTRLVKISYTRIDGIKVFSKNSHVKEAVILLHQGQIVLLVHEIITQISGQGE